MKPFIINCGCYPFDVLVYFGEDREPMFKMLGEMIGKDEADKLRSHHFSRGYTAINDNGTMVLWCKQPPCNPEWVSIMVHESLHVVQFLFERIQMPMNDDTSEAQAYLQQYIVKQILEHYDRAANTKQENKRPRSKRVLRH